MHIKYTRESETYTEVGSEADPADIRREQPSADGVNLSPDVGQVADGTPECKDVDGRGDWSSHGEVEWGPEQVQGKLDAVESGTLLGEGYSLRVDGGSTGRPRSVGGIAHGSIQASPYWAEDVSWGMEWWLLQSAILPLCVACCNVVRKRFYWRRPILRLMEKPIAVPHATGRSIAAAGLEKRKVGRVREGM